MIEGDRQHVRRALKTRRQVEIALIARAEVAVEVTARCARITARRIGTPTTVLRFAFVNMFTQPKCSMLSPTGILTELLYTQNGFTFKLLFFA